MLDDLFAHVLLPLHCGKYPGLTCGLAYEDVTCVSELDVFVAGLPLNYIQCF